MLEKFHDVLLVDDDILFFDEDFSKFSSFVNDMGILGVEIDQINLDDDNNFYEDDPDTGIHVRVLAWHNKFEKCKALEKDMSKELMPVV